MKTHRVTEPWRQARRAGTAGRGVLPAVAHRAQGRGGPRAAGQGDLRDLLGPQRLPRLRPRIREPHGIWGGLNELERKQLLADSRSRLTTLADRASRRRQAGAGDAEVAAPAGDARGVEAGEQRQGVLAACVPRASRTSATVTPSGSSASSAGAPAGRRRRRPPGRSRRRRARPPGPAGPARAARPGRPRRRRAGRTARRRARRGTDGRRAGRRAAPARARPPSDRDAVEQGQDARARARRARRRRGRAARPPSTALAQLGAGPRPAPPATTTQRPTSAPGARR